MELPIDKRNNIVNMFYQNLSDFTYSDVEYIFGVDRYSYNGLEIVSKYNPSNNSRCILFFVPVVIQNTFHAEYGSGFERRSEVKYGRVGVPVLKYDNSISKLFMYSFDCSGANYYVPDRSHFNTGAELDIHSGYNGSMKFDLEMDEAAHFQLSTVSEPFIDYPEFKKLQEIIKSVQSAVFYETIGRDNVIRYPLTTKLSVGA